MIKITKKTWKSLENAVDIEIVDLKQYLTVILKDHQMDVNVDALIANINTDMHMGSKYFWDYAFDSERTRLRELTVKWIKLLNEKNDTDNQKFITLEDCEFLEEIAKRKYLDAYISEASCMFRFIVELKPTFSRAWVGWALCEQDQNHLDVVDSIYTMAFELLPRDYFICLFAADYFIETGRKNEAKEILTKAKEQLVADGRQLTKSYEAICHSLSRII